MKNFFKKALFWFQLQRKSLSWDAWTRDASQVVRHYKFKAVPTSLDCTEYDVKVVRSKIGGSSQRLEYRWPREKVISCQTASC